MSHICFGGKNSQISPLNMLFQIGRYISGTLNTALPSMVGMQAVVDESEIWFKTYTENCTAKHLKMIIQR